MISVLLEISNLKLRGCLQSHPGFLEENILIVELPITQVVNPWN